MLGASRAGRQGTATSSPGFAQLSLLKTPNVGKTRRFLGLRSSEAKTTATEEGNTAPSPGWWPDEFVLTAVERALPGIRLHPDRQVQDVVHKRCCRLQAARPHGLDYSSRTRHAQTLSPVPTQDSL